MSHQSNPNWHWLIATLTTAILASCAGVKSATPLSIEELRTQPLVADVGFTNAFGVPSLTERFAKRKNLRLAILQVAYAVQGRPEQTFVTANRTFGFVTSWTERTTSQVMVPTSFAKAAAVHFTFELQKALANRGFDVIPHKQVAATKAYKKHYGRWPMGYTMESSGFVVVGAHPMRVKNATGLMSFGQLHLVWPETAALKEIRSELGEDTLLLCVRVQASTMRGRSAKLSLGAQINVTDPEFVGYGIGGFGHMVTSLDATTERSGVDVPGFLKVISDHHYRVHWTPMFQDIGRVHTAFAKGFARELHQMAFPTTGD